MLLVSGISARGASVRHQDAQEARREDLMVLVVFGTGCIPKAARARYRVFIAMCKSMIALYVKCVFK